LGIYESLLKLLARLGMPLGDELMVIAQAIKLL
jgi:hypothetical protein